MKSIADVIKLSSEYLENKGVTQPRRQAEDVISLALGLKRLELYLNFHRPLEESELQKCRDYLLKRGSKCPIAYIHKSVEFYNCHFQVTPDVLIPRQETEILVDKVATVLASQETESLQVCDLCTGSGCIGISLKKRFPHFEVTLADVSTKALEVAKLNATQNDVNVAFLQGDFLHAIEGRVFDVIVCNPPYVTQSEWVNLEPEVREHEPYMALVAANEGMEFYEKLATAAACFLKPKGRLFLEIGEQMGQPLKALFNKEWKAEISSDWANKDRFFFLEKQ